MTRMHPNLLESEKYGEASMDLLSGAMCGGRHEGKTCNVGPKSYSRNVAQRG